MLCLLWYLLVSPSGYFGSGLKSNSTEIAYQLLLFDFIDSIIYKNIAPIDIYSDIERRFEKDARGFIRKLVIRTIIRPTKKEY
jgi:hypothetical protein